MTLAKLTSARFAGSANNCLPPLARRLALWLCLFCWLLAGKAMSMPLTKDSLQLPDGTWVIADDKQFWLRQPPRSANAELNANPLGAGLVSDRDAQRTRMLLEGVFSAAWLSNSTPGNVSKVSEFTLPRYLFSLASNHQTIKVTVPLGKRFAARLRSMGRIPEAEFGEQFVKDESPHEDLVASDLAALGINSEGFLADLQPAGAIALARYFEHLVESDDPITAIGYMYALQKSSLLMDKSMIERMESSLPPNVIASRTHRTHGGVGDNAKHVRDTEDLIASLPLAEKRAVALAVFNTIHLMKNRADYPGDKFIDELASKHRMKKS